MKTTLDIIGRKESLFDRDIQRHADEIDRLVGDSRFLVLGGAGSIGQAVSKEIFRRNPKKLDIVDISENNLVELVRDIRSSYGYIKGDFRTLALDIGSCEFDAFMDSDGQYDYILNLSALKHVRSEKDPYTLMRLIDVNVFNTEKTIQLAIQCDVKKYFCVSTDKAANPVNMMGASKRIMEMFMIRSSKHIDISTARFANVAFSDGSLLYGFTKRVEKNQPLAAPNDIKRYFLSAEESGQLCLFSCLFGENKDIFFPKLDESLDLISFSEIAEKYLYSLGYEPFHCRSEKEAREMMVHLPNEGKWPCVFTSSTTTGEKEVEEFYMENERLDLERFKSIGIVKSSINYSEKNLDDFKCEIEIIRNSKHWNKESIVKSFAKVLPEFNHRDTGFFLDKKM